MKTRELSKAEYPLWDQLIADSAQGKTFLRSDWLTMLSETEPDLHIYLLGCFDNHDKLVGGLALGYQQRSNMKIVNGYEFLYSGPVIATWPDKHPASRAAKTSQVLNAISNTLRDEFAYVSMETQPSLTDVRSFIYGGWQVRPVYSHLWRMENIEAAWASMNHVKRNSIRHARQTYSFEVEESDDAVLAFARLYRDTMAKFHWLPSLSWESMLLERFRWMHARGGARLFTARDRDRSVAGAVIVILSPDDKTGLLWRVGTDKDFIAAGGVPALYWHAASGVASEYPNVDFGWSPQASLSQFKDYMGAELEIHFRISRCNDPLRYKLYTSAMSAKDNLYNLLAPIAYEPWQKLRYGRKYQRTLEQANKGTS
jgi:hypothetical protein